MCGICPLLCGQSPEASPLAFEGAYLGDFYGNAAGGIKTGTGYVGMGNLKVGFDTGKAGWWKGGTLFVNGASIHGESLTGNFLGDLQVASNIDAGEHVYLHELWFRQQFGRISLTLGLQDLNIDYMTSEGGGGFVNSSFGVPPVIACNVPVPIFPLTGLGASVRWQVDERWAWQTALFDGDQTVFDHNPHNLRWSFSKNDGLLAMTEVHLNERYKLGAYYHSADKNYGFYLFGDQTVYEHADRKLTLFAQLAVAPKDRNETNYSLGLGANMFGVFGKKQRDALGLALTHAGLHRTSHKHETAIELYYKYPINGNIALQPDLQYILNPSGTERKLPDALVGMLRLHIGF